MHSGNGHFLHAGVDILHDVQGRTIRGKTRTDRVSELHAKIARAAKRSNPSAVRKAVNVDEAGQPVGDREQRPFAINGHANVPNMLLSKDDAYQLTMKPADLHNKGSQKHRADYAYKPSL